MFSKVYDENFQLILSRFDRYPNLDRMVRKKQTNFFLLENATYDSVSLWS